MTLIYVLLLIISYILTPTQIDHDRPFQRFAGIYEVQMYDYLGEIQETDLHIYLSPDGLIWTDVKSNHINSAAEFNNDGDVCILIEQKLIDGPSHIIAAIINDDVSYGEVRQFGGIGETRQIKLNRIFEEE